MLIFGLGGILLLLGGFFLLRPRQLIAWFKGSIALLILLAGLALLILGMDLRHYQHLSDLAPVAQLDIQSQDDGLWRVTLHTARDTQDADAITAAQTSSPAVYLIKGDQWQLDARVLLFSGPLTWLGLRPVYRLDRISGRYIAFEDETSQPRTAFDLNPSASWIDFWQLDHRFGLPMLQAKYGSATFMPLRDGASYEVLLSATGLLAKPLNDEAKQAVAEWF